ncbi:MAG: arginine--tRNA ligase [Patescibacteria group bacterium]
MYAISKAKQQILKDIKRAVGKEYTPSLDDLSTPPKPEMGDISFPCFSLAKALKKNPAELANELQAKMAAKGIVKKISSEGPYLNFSLNDSVLAKEVFERIEEYGEKYGSQEKSQKAKIVVEYANINTHKIIHVGHLRNFFIGEVVINIFRANGQNVIPVYYINDLGMHVAHVIWAYQKFFKGDEPETCNERNDLLGKLYVQAVKKVADNPLLKKEVSKVFQDLENMNGEAIKIWKKTRKWSLDYIHSVYNELGLEIKKKYYESDYIAQTRELIEELIKKGIATHSEGAWIVDLQDEKLGVNLLVKSDKTLLYNAKDLALAFQKEKDFSPKRSIYIVDARQSFALKQLFATLARMNFKKDLEHLSYEFITLKGGAMSSREGNVIRYEKFRDAMIEMAQFETKQRHSDWDEEKICEVARKIAFAAMRFGMLRQDMEKKITFDIHEALSFEGFTGPYLLYTSARLKSILRKAKTKEGGRLKPDSSGEFLTQPVEHKLIMLIASYPEVIFSVGSSLQISCVAQYLFELAKTFSEYYESTPILKADKKTASCRLALVNAVSQVLENGLSLLGIDTVKEM